METRLVGYSTLARLEKCAPMVGSTSPEVARKILGLLAAEAKAENERTGIDEKPYWQVDLTVITSQLPDTITPKRVGGICRSMGLYLWRRNSGFFVAWNKQQLMILVDYFKLNITIMNL